MKISFNGMGSLLGTAPPNTKKTEKASLPPPGAADGVRVSQEAKTLHQAREAYHALPELREDRVAEIRRRLQSGTYELDLARVADALLDDEPRID